MEKLIQQGRDLDSNLVTHAIKGGFDLLGSSLRLSRVVEPAMDTLSTSQPNGTLLGGGITHGYNEIKPNIPERIGMF